MNEPPRVPDPRLVPRAERPGAWLPRPWPEQDGPVPISSAVFAPTEGLDTDPARVRPFVVTGGRTRPLHDGMRIESLLMATPAALSAPVRFELRRILELAQRAVSLAEVAAALAIPIGVARVLAADLQHSNLIRLVEPHELSVDVIERIRDLVRAL